MATAPVTDALLATRHGGRVVLAGLKGGTEIPLRTDLIINRALTVIGAFGVDARAYAEAIRIIESRRFPLEKLHTHTYGLDDTVLAIETLAGEVAGEAAVHVSVHPGAL
jgi:threonine dehydrogenase-like Zn-dependent dehydrogenase